MTRLPKEFFTRDVLEVAPDLPGRVLVRKFRDDRILRLVITEVEAYSGEEDLACHASKGRTKRTEIMYADGGHVYVYLIYGMYWMLNFVTGRLNNPQAVLIRGVEAVSGPGRLTRLLEIDDSFYGIDLSNSDRLWLEEGAGKVGILTAPRIGIDYAGEPWLSKPWRFLKKS